jgi:hypothetical protein
MICFLIHRLIVIFIVLLFSVIGIYSDEKNPSLYIGKIELGEGISKDNDMKLRNSITLGIIKRYKDKYQVIDDDVVKSLFIKLKIQQQTGCSTDKCERMIDDALNTDFKISGNLMNDSKDRLKLNLKLIKFTNSNPYLQNQTDKIFHKSQLGYYINELVLSLLDNNYKINDTNAPNINLDDKYSDSNMKEITISQLKTLDLKAFKNSDDEIVEVIDGSKIILSKGDSLFNNKNYEDAIIKYESILNNIYNRVSQENQKKLSTYIDTIKTRVESSLNNKYKNEIELLDKDLRFLDTMNSDELESLSKKYNLILYGYNSTQYKKSPEIQKSILDRQEKVDVKLFLLIEKNCDTYYENYQFSKAVLEYKSLLSKVEQSPKTKLITTIKNRINEKIKTTNENGSSFVRNKVISNCSLARRKNFQYGLAKDNANGNDIQENREIIKQSLENARSLLLNSEFVDNSLIDLYNKTVNKINQDNNEKIALPITQVQTKLSYTSEKIDSSFFHFPGSPQMNWEKKINDGEISLKSNFLYYGSWVSIYAVSLGTLKYLNDVYDYTQMGSSLFPILLFPELAPIFIVEDYKSFSSAREEILKDSQIINNGLGLFGLFYLLSYIDINSQGTKKDIFGKNQSFPKYQVGAGYFNLKINSDSIQNMGRDSQLRINYDYSF